MITRGKGMNRRFAMMAGLMLVAGLFPLTFGARPAAAAQVQAAPAAPEDLVAFPADRDPIKIGIRWDDKSDNETGFEIERRIYRSDTEFDLIATNPANQTEFADGNIRNNVQYEYRVRAVNADGASGYTNAVIAFFGSPGKIRVEPNKVDFGTVRVGSTRIRRITIRNVGSSTVTFLVSMPEGSEFSLSEGLGTEFELEPGQSRKIGVQYTPAEVGTHTAIVRVLLGNDAAEVQVRLKGKGSNDGGGGGGSKIKVSPIPVDFGKVAVGATRTRQFTVRNTGQSPASVSISLASGKQFNIVSGGGDVEIAPGASHKVSVTFSPSSTGAAVGVAEVSLGKSNVSVKLKGVGVASRR